MKLHNKTTNSETGPVSRDVPESKTALQPILHSPIS